MISFFLMSVNKTWPNQRTELCNLATPATGIKAVAYHCCHIHDSPKRQADVIIIEQHEYSIQNETLADLIGHVRAQFGTHAALVFISTLHVFPPLHQRTGAHETYETQIQCLERGVCPHPDLLCSFNQTALYLNPPDESYQTFLEQHGVTEISFRGALMRWLSGAAHIRTNVSRCDLLRSFWIDNIHLNTTAQLFISDALLQHFRRAVIYSELEGPQRSVGAPAVLRPPITSTKPLPRARLCYELQNLPVLHADGFAWEVMDNGAN